MAFLLLGILRLGDILGSLLVIGVLYLFVKVLQVVIKHRRINASLDCFPSCDRHWFYGSIGRVKGGGANWGFLQSHLERCKAYPRAYRRWHGPMSRLTLVHPDTIRPVLKVADPKSVMYDLALKPWLGEGLLIARGRKWARNRRLLTPAFHFDILRSYVNVFNDVIDVFLGKMEDLVEEDRPLELFQNVSLMTLDIILQCAFSYHTDCQNAGKRHPYIDAVYNLAEKWSKRTGQIITFLIPPLYWVSEDGRKFKKLCEIVHREANIIIDARKKELEENGPEFLKNKKNLDFLDILLTAKDENGNGMSREDIRAEVDTFLFEGHDTTASGISWTLYLLAKHPEYQTQVQKEVDELISERGSDRLDWASLSRLPVLTRCLKESMRLYCPVPLISRELTRDMDIDGHKVLAGTTVNIPIWALHHNPTVWGDDHMEYKPSRFEEENVQKMDPFAFLPFSAGPRNCIGQTFALSEEKTVLARLLHRYTFSVADENQPLDLCVRVVLRAEKEIKLKVTRRS